MTAKVEIYTTRVCPYCVRAKQLLQHKGVAYIEIDASDDDVRVELLKRADGRRTVPQIFINDVGVGGYDDIAALNVSGKLDEMLKG